jgi:hypothetical protein
VNVVTLIVPLPAAARLALALTLLLLVGLAGPTRAQGGVIHPGDKKPPPPRVPDAVHAQAFPGLEPFRQSPYWKKLADHLRRSGLTEDAVVSLNQELTVIRMNQGLAERAGEDIDYRQAPPEQVLGAKVSEDRRLWLWQIPLVLDRIEPLWTTAEWDAEQFGEARSAVRFFSEQEGPPRIELVEGRQADNHQQLERLMAWYRAEVARPESYALMLITDERGPWRPVDASAPSSLKVLGERAFDAERRLALRRDEKAGGPWLVQLLTGKKPAWTRALPQTHAESALSFDGEPRALGELGWMVRLKTGEGKPVALYLDGKAQPLFYFTSW